MIENSVHDIVDFSIIRYANSWEDADILLEGLQLRGGEKIVSIASGGDNTLSLLSTNPESIDAVDLSAVQLYLTELKMMAFLKLEYEELLQFLGIADCTSLRRLQYYKAIENQLSQSARKFWTSNILLLENGIIHAGKFEHYFKKFREYFLPFVHSERLINELLKPKTEAEQQHFYQHKWNSKRWQLLLSIFFSKYVMGKAGRDPAFLRHVEISVSQYIRQKTENALQSSLCAENYFLNYILKGNFQSYLPHYLRPQHFEIIRKNISCITLKQIEMGRALETKKFDACYCSNIFEYMSAENFKSETSLWATMLNSGTKIAFWNLMNQRSFAETNAKEFVQFAALSNDLSKKDKGFFYSRFLIEQKK